MKITQEQKDNLLGKLKEYKKEIENIEQQLKENEAFEILRCLPNYNKEKEVYMKTKNRLYLKDDWQDMIREIDFYVLLQQKDDGTFQDIGAIVNIEDDDCYLVSNQPKIFKGTCTSYLQCDFLKRIGEDNFKTFIKTFPFCE